MISPCRTLFQTTLSVKFSIIAAMKKSRFFILSILLVLLSSTFSFAVPVSYGLSEQDSVYVSKNGNYIVVSRGCEERYYKQSAPVDSSLSRDSLLARVFGNKPFQDSIGLYEAWSKNCERYADKSLTESRALGGIGFAALATLGTVFILIDYEHTGSAIAGYSLGGALYGFAGYLLIKTFFFENTHVEKQRALGNRYKEEAERRRLLIAPSINFQEPGGGLLMQYNF